MKQSVAPRSKLLISLILLLLPLLPICRFALAQQGATCSTFTPCKVGCCSKYGSCGFGDDFCGSGCQGTCNATAECGKYAAPAGFACPLNVCCSKYGFCGYTSGFCDSECQNKGGCQEIPTRPSCPEQTDAMAAEVRIGYYGAWSAGRSCDAMEPENIPAGVLTHINVAFEYVSAENEITDQYGIIVGRVSRLKNVYPGLRTAIALGGWSFNDPPTQTRFSNMASTVPNRQKFIASLIKYMKTYGVDGVDIDWEYPVADDRGGVPADFNNFVALCSDIRDAFDSYDPGWQLTITLPASYWYLRGFDIKRLEKYVNWFNVMTYDIHGLWDQKNIWTGPYLKGHTNLTEIEEGLDLLWRNGIDSKKVVMGYGFYGRGFTMTDVNCNTPPYCTFDGPGFAGDCTNEPGILSYSEVLGKEEELGATVKYDDVSSVKYMIYGSNQWISFDDAESFEKKKKFMFSRCLKGLMIWELGLDTAKFDALTGLFGEDAVSRGSLDTSLTPEETALLVEDLAAYTGQNCYVSPQCTKGKSNCASGYSSVEVGHFPLQMKHNWQSLPCKEGEWHHVCCPTKAMPKNCEWVGAPKRSEFGCNRGCGPSQFELTTDAFTDKEGKGKCYSGSRSLCCDSTDTLDKCRWTDCGWSDSTNGNCNSDEHSVGLKRYDKDNGELCRSQTGLGNGGSGGPTTHHDFRSFCCPDGDRLYNCDWSDDKKMVVGPVKDYTPYICTTKECNKYQLAITKAQMPETLFDLLSKNTEACSIWSNYPGTTAEYALCCAPPTGPTDNWPVRPTYLWSGASDELGQATWQWADDFGNNDEDKKPDNLQLDPGQDPYGFVMLDGPVGALSKNFARHFTVVTGEEPRNTARRSYVTTNQTVLDATFDHSEETFHVYCNLPNDSKECNEVFYKGATDTVISLPNHVGEGPWARIVSMEPDHNPPPLPSWVIRRRDLAANMNGIYKLTVDYNFNLIVPKDQEPIYMRVDYTNLISYWDEVTDQPANSKRSAESPVDFHAWKSKVDKAKEATYASDQDNWEFSTSGKTDFSPDGPVPPSPYQNQDVNSPPRDVVATRDNSIDRRWYGVFGDWLKRLNTITKEHGGVLPMGLSKAFTIYSGRLRCTNGAGVTITAGLDVTAEVDLQMRARYAYYFSGTVVPPHIIDSYVFLGAQPQVYAGVTVRGNAELGYRSDVKKLISTITYPGMSIKGVVTVGPSLDLFGQIEGKVTVSGQLKVGAKYTFNPVEMYLPNDDRTHDRASSQMETFDTDQQGIAPVLEASVRAEVDVHLRVTPELDCGIKVGAPIGPFKDPFIDGHVAVFMNTSLHFNAHVTGEATNQASNWEYGYKVELLWRIGIAAVATLYDYKRWATDTYYPVSWQTIPIYGPIVVKSSGSSSKRVESTDPEPWILSEDPLPEPVFGPSSLSAMSDVWSLTSTPTIGENASFISRRAANRETEFPIASDFKCTSGGNSPCDTNFPERRDIVGAIHGGGLLRHEKRAVTDCRGKIPRLYYNCKGYFADITVTGSTGNAVTIPGLCSSVRNFLSNNGIITNQYKLTFDPENSGTRRTESCATSRNPCSGVTGENALRKTQLGTPFSSVPSLVNCDEFPFASVEEGGAGWGGINPGNPLGTTRTCIPAWQNTLQGICHDILRDVETNVEYFNDATAVNDDANAATWQPWSSNSWTTKNSWTAGTGQGRQRLTRYEADQPVKLRGVNVTERADRSLSWFHKRNFTLYLVKNEPGRASTFPGNQFSSGRLFATNKGLVPATTVVSDAAWIICAVSLRGQDRYRWARTGSGLAHNGYCWDGQTIMSVWNGATTTLRYFSCDIDFTGAAHTKRDPVGYWEGEPIYNVRRSANARFVDVKVPNDELPLPDYRNAVPLSE